MSEEPYIIISPRWGDDLCALKLQAKELLLATGMPVQFEFNGDHHRIELELQWWYNGDSVK